MDYEKQDNHPLGYSGSETIPGVGGAEVQGLGTTQNGLTPITSATLQPTTPLKLPTAPVSTVASGILGMTGAVKDAAIQQQQLEQKAREAKATQNAQGDALQNTYDQILGVQSSRPQAETDAGLQTKQTAVADATNKLEASQRAQVNEIRALESSNITDAGKQAATSAINRKYAFEQADLALIQSAANRDYSTAQNIVDRKIELQLEPLKTKLDSVKFFYQENKDVLNKADYRAYQNQVTKLQKEYDTEKTDKTNISNLQIKLAEKGLGSAATQVGSATSFDEAVSVAADAFKAENRDPSSLITSDFAGFIQGLDDKAKIAFASVPDTDKSVVSQLVNGDALIADIVKTRGTQGTKDINRYISEAQAVDPNFSINTNKTRFTFLQGWNEPNGKSSTTRNALNTALGHLADFKVNADALDPGTVKKLNSVKNILSTETGDPKVLRLRTDINALATEVATAYKGGQPTDTEIKNWEETIAADFSKTQFQGVSDELAKLLSSKVTASRYQYSSTMGKEYNQTIIDPDKKKALLDAGISASVFPIENTGNKEQYATDVLTTWKAKNPDKISQFQGDRAKAEKAIGRKLTPAEFLEAYPNYK